MEHPSLYWDAGEEPIRTPAELREILGRLHTEAQADPFLAALALASGDTLWIGLGRSESVLTFMHGSLNPPYFVSQGLPDREGWTQWGWAQDVSGFPASSLIAVDAAMAAMAYFLTHGGLDPAVDWRDDRL